MSEFATGKASSGSALHASQEVLTGNQLRVVNSLGTLAAQDETAPSEVVPTSEHLVLPPTTLDAREVKHMLETRNSSTPDERIIQLLDYAWVSTSIIERPVPAELLPYIPLRPGEWYVQNKVRLDLILKVRGHKTHTDRYEAEDIEEETQKFNTTPFIRNAEAIKSISWHRGDGTKVAFAARMMLHQADKLFLKEFQPG